MEGKDPLTKRGVATRKRKEAVRTWLMEEVTVKSKEERGRTTETLLHSESLFRQITDVRAMLDKGNKMIEDQWNTINEKF